MILLDIETLSAPPSELEKLMPENLRSAEMPEELRVVPQPDIGKCPEYSGNSSKRADWVMKEKNKLQERHNAALAAHWSKIEQGRQKFIADAALNAKTAHVKLVGIRDTETGVTVVITWEPSPEIRDDLHEASESIMCLPEEGRVIKEAFDWIIGGREICGYFIKQFDIPFLQQRAWITGVPRRLPFLKRGRYWSEKVIDLYEEWGMGERYASTGGLDGLAAMLGAKRKTGTGENFAALYARDPLAGVRYLVDELETLEDCARRMGILQP